MVKFIHDIDDVQRHSQVVELCLADPHDIQSQSFRSRLFDDRHECVTHLTNYLVQHFWENVF